MKTTPNVLALRSAAAAGLALLAVLAAPAPARAGEYHHQSILPGERAMALGGAFTALGSDTTSAWYNPAGLGFLKGTAFSLQTGVYGVTSDATSQGGGLRAIENGQFVTFPSAAVVVRQLGGERHRVGFAILTPTHAHRSGGISAENVVLQRGGGQATFGNYTVLQDERDTSVWFGPTYGLRLHPKVSLGASMFFVVRSRDLVSKLMGGTNGEAQESGQLGIDMLHFSLAWLFGVRAELWPGLFVGATFRTPNVRLRGTATVNLVAFNGAGTGLVQPLADTDAYSQLPWRASFGVAYEVPRTFALAADVTVHGSVDRYQLIAGAALTPEAGGIAKERVVNVNVGAEYYLGGVVPLRAGFFTNLSAQGPLTAGAVAPSILGASGLFGGEGDTLDQYGLSFGVGVEKGRTSLGLGVNYVFGTGTSQLGSARGERTQKNLFVGISGSYAF